MKRLRLITIGKIKMPFWQNAAAFYSKRLSHSWDIQESCLKDAPASLAPEKRSVHEGERILAALRPGDYMICLDEHGKQLSSPQLSRLLENFAMQSALLPCFVVGGSYGFSKAVLQQAQQCISLSTMTFPHEMAQVILLEQLYRAESISKGNPYHHD